MTNSKLIQLLRTFSTEEWRRFNEFVASPFFNKKKELIPFCQYLRKHAPNFSEKKVKKEIVFQAIFPKKKYDEKRLSYLMNYLLELAEKFIGWKKIESKNIDLDLNILASFADRKLPKHFQQKYRKTFTNINEHPDKDEQYFLHQFLLTETTAKESESRMVRTDNQHFQKVTQHLDHFYFLNKLKYCCTMIDRQQVLAVNYEINFIEELKHYLLQQSSNPPEIDLFLNVLLMLTEEDADLYFKKLKQVFQSNFSSFPKSTKKNAYFYLINFCLRKIRKGEQPYLAEALDIYWSGIQNETLFENGYLSPWTFTNVVKLALRLKRFDWIQTFIWENESKMEEQFRENALYYNLSELYYFTKDFDKALEQLNQVKFSDLNYHLGSRVILIKIYYETDEQNALTSLIASFTIFLKRNKSISNNLRQTYLNFCDLIHQIIKAKKTDLTSLKAKAEQTPLLADRQWLIEILEKEVLKS